MPPGLSLTLVSFKPKNTWR